MLFKMYAIKDEVAGEFGPVQVLKNDAVACRMFKNVMINEAKNNINPDDFSLYCLGDFDNESGSISPTLSLVPLTDAEPEHV